MPTRVNGIGTAYIGQRDLQAQRGVCESCNRAGTLSNYETRLWFTVFFIPIIPLTKQQILNYCPLCTRHRVLPLDKWREVQAESISRAIAKVDANPDSPEQAIECHATMAACGKREEAAQYAEAMATRFKNNAEVLMYLGGWFERIGQSQRSDKCFDQALVADPKHPGAQRAAAIGLLQAGKPREAEAMLAAFMPPSQNFEPSVFVMLGEAYQAAGDHAAAARLFKLVADTTPAAAKNKNFRKSVAKSEAALGQFGSVLAPIPLYRRPILWWSALAAAIVIGLVGLDRYFAQHRETYFVNGLEKPIKVQLDGGSPFEVPPGSKRRVEAAEGSHKVAVIEPAALAREEEFTVDGNIIGRWSGGQVHVVDPTRSAVIVWEESVYAENPRDQTSDFKLHAGELVSTFDHIDYKFEEFPRSVNVEGSSKKVAKHRVVLEKIEPMDLLLGSPDTLTGEARLNYLESHVATADKRSLLLQYYWIAAAEQNQLDRCREFLKKSLGDRPLDIDLHRMYEAAAEWSGQNLALAAEYDAMIAKEPDNVDLLYLRGRIAPYGTDSIKYYDAVLQKAPNHGFTWSAKAYLANGAGRFDEALKAIDKAIAADSERGEWKSTRRDTLQALGRYEDVIKEIKTPNPAGGGKEWTKYPDLIEVLAQQGKMDQAEAVYTKLSEAVDRDWPEDPLQWKLKSRLTLLLASKKYDELQAEVAQLSDAMTRSIWSFRSQLAAGKLDEAAGGVESSPQVMRGIETLCISIGWENAHNNERAEAALKQSIALLAEGSTEQRIVAGWLSNPPADLTELLPKITDLAIEPEDKVIVLLALAQTKRPGSDKLIGLAEQLKSWPSARKEFVDASLTALRQGR